MHMKMALDMFCHLVCVPTVSNKLECRFVITVTNDTCCSGSRKS